ncbi:hypothetical protein CEP53_004633 [Fusarium sp. AF-6]|nr:hypothetical protein CEP53_004633 [Fusarium sp. AF-6]
MADPSSPPPYSVQQPPYSPGPAAYKPSPTPPGPYPSRLPASGAWLAPDPRSSSTQSLLPVYPSETSLQKTPQTPAGGDHQGRRKLLVIYLHGFLGNDQSFRSFPAHVHALLTNLLVDSHVIHSKIYPRYKTYRAVDVARDNFSEWLTPHESPTTDVVLVGHSMGGILAADVILMPNPSPYGTYPFKHRILGHISMDCPFLGLHPGIVVSGISSLFKPAATPQDHSQENTNLNAPYGTSETTNPDSSSLNLTTSYSSVPGSPSSATSASVSHLPHDPFFNQPFFNDSALQERPFVRRMLHFASKYRSEGLVQAAAKHVVSYLEFGSCLADLSGLESRYDRLRALEDVDELQLQDQNRDPRAPTTRVRFVNYYTLCTGRPKTPKSETPKTGTSDEFASSQQSGFSTPNLGPGSSFLQPDTAENHLRASQESPRPSITIEHRDTMGNATNHQTLLDANHKDSPTQANTTQNDSFNDTEAIISDINRLSMHDIDPTPIDEPTTSDEQRPTEEIELAPLPNPPTPPELPDVTIYTDKDERKQAEKEAKRLQRAYDHAVKDHAKAVREREKLLEKRRRRAQKEADKALKEAARQEKEALKEAEREAREEQRRVEKEAAEQQARDWEDHRRAAEAEVIAEARDLNSSRPKKLRKFCNLPRDGSKVTDPTWVDVFMADVDEVGAHCGLFFPGQHYEQLVGDVGSRIMGWVQEDLTKRAILDMGV